MIEYKSELLNHVLKMGESYYGEIRPITSQMENPK